MDVWLQDERMSVLAHQTLFKLSFSFRRSHVLPCPSHTTEHPNGNTVTFSAHAFLTGFLGRFVFLQRSSVLRTLCLLQLLLP